MMIHCAAAPSAPPRSGLARYVRPGPGIEEVKNAGSSGRGILVHRWDTRPTWRITP